MACCSCKHWLQACAARVSTGRFGVEFGVEGGESFQAAVEGLGEGEEDGGGDCFVYGVVDGCGFVEY